MKILGINNMHDASAALLVDGKVAAAAAEERFCRVKHAKGFPREAVRYCLDAGGVAFEELDVIVASWRPWALRVRATEALRSLFKSKDLFRAKAERGVGQMGGEWKELFTLRSLLRREFGEGRYSVRYLSHHLAHAACAYYGSPFSRAAILTVDGAGEEDSSSLWKATGTQIRRLDAIPLPTSLGQFYAAVTAFLGFKVQSDEYKVMGLAANGKPVYHDHLMKHVFRLRPDGRYTEDPYFLDYHMARTGRFRPEALRLLGPARGRDEELTDRHADIAASAQAVAETVIFHILRHLRRQSGCRDLCLAGGVALNCVVNGKILQETGFERVFVPPAPADDGTALGAALFLENASAGRRVTEPMGSAALGSSFTVEECRRVLEATPGIRYVQLPPEEVPRRTAQLLADGRIIGWFQGRMEWGPRALGNRSLLADPRRAEMKRIVNRIIKKREGFRPFAPSILQEHAAAYFENYCPSPYMTFAFPVKDEFKERIPAVVHTDGTARPQEVSPELCPRYYSLIREFYAITGVPLVLNTSFNVQEPIVATPQHALTTFLGNDIDYLILEDFVVERAA